MGEGRLLTKIRQKLCAQCSLKVPTSTACHSHISICPRTFAKPKSVSLTWPSLSSNTFSGFKSASVPVGIISMCAYLMLSRVALICAPECSIVDVMCRFILCQRLYCSSLHPEQACDDTVYDTMYGSKVLSTVLANFGVYYGASTVRLPYGLKLG